ncbi:hypothetical protein GZ59_24820 [Pectobacterium atrosepticum]|nr:hypothetical protein GZ59_24820 [Pectobacterium atrosepticum]
MSDYQISVGRYARLTSLPNGVYALVIYGENVKSSVATPVGGNRAELLGLTEKHSPLSSGERSGLADYLMQRGVPE